MHKSAIKTIITELYSNPYTFDIWYIEDQRQAQEHYCMHHKDINLQLEFRQKETGGMDHKDIYNSIYLHGLLTDRV